MIKVPAKTVTTELFAEKPQIITVRVGVVVRVEVEVVLVTVEVEEMVDVDVDVDVKVNAEVEVNDVDEDGVSTRVEVVEKKVERFDVDSNVGIGVTTLTTPTMKVG